MRIIPLIIAVFSLVSIENLPAQNCGCAEEGNCPYPFAANSNTQVCYEITDAFNNNLASPTQGICGVSVKFRHGRIGSMNLTLTAPSGTQVQLVGTNGNCNTWTPIATWDILFLPCGETCVPDTVNSCPYPCVFDGCPTDCPWANANYSGYYHPFSGCLEDFNTGPVNGQWCLEIDNNAQFNGGSILDFEIILCDQSGILCCDADAGNLNFEPDVNACVGDSSLLLDPNPIYGAIVPDTLEYGYTYAIFEQNTLLAYDPLPNLIPYTPGTYQVCGLSYLYADTASMPDPGTVWTPQTLNDTLNSANPPFCGNIATNCILVQIAVPPLPTNLTDTICQGDTLFVGAASYTGPGMYSDTLNSFFGCDSIVNLTLTVLPLDTTFLVETLCPGETYVVGNSTYSATGAYTNVFQNVNGCDSTVYLDLTVLMPMDTLLMDTICRGDSVVVNGITYMDTGIYMDTLTSFFNCDSIVTLDLTVVDVSVSILPVDTLDCQQLSVTLTTSAASSLGTLSYEWSLLGGTLPGTNTSPALTVNAPDSYIVTVEAEGCTSADTVAVFQNAIPPTAVAFAVSTDTLTCGVTNLQLDGSSSTGAGMLSWLWSAQGGSPISNPASQTINSSMPDVYELVVTDLDNNCSDTTEVTVFQNITPPVANAGVDTILSCSVSLLNLDGSASTPSGNISFAWSAVAGGNILPPANIVNPAVNTAGTYQLLVTNLENACQDSDFVVVKVDTLAPNALIALPDGDSLTCVLDEISLDGASSTGSQNFDIQWVGNISSGQGTLLATVAQPGDFTLILTDTQNGCIDSATVSIGIDTLSPFADAGVGDTLDCTDITADLGGPGTSTGPEFGYLWTSSPGGAFTSPVDLPQATADSSGTYYLTVTNLLNGCTAVDSVVVSSNYSPPIADAGPDGALTCQDTTVTLDASNSTIVPFAIFEWQNSGGVQISNDVQVTVNYPDTFIFTVSFAFCKSSDTVIVTEVSTPPVADAGPDMQLDCTTGQVTLNGSGSDTGPNLAYSWAGPGIVSGKTTLTPLVNEAGTYILSVMNGATLCTSYDTVLVTLDTAACTPVVDAGADGLVNCYNQIFADTLQASGSVGPNFSYQWTAISGTILNAGDPFAPVVRPGEFVFSVTNTAVGLTAFDTVLVVADTLPPVADAGPQILPLNCPQLAGCYQLDANGSSQGPDFTYAWETLDGSFCGATNVLNPEVQGAGIYELIVTNLPNGCTASDAVLVQLLDFPPEADAGSTFQIPCSDTTAVLHASGSSVGPNFTYEWFSFGGNILSGGNSLNPVVSTNNPQDTFFLTVTNNLNACQDVNFVVVFAPAGCFPACAASVSGPLDCDTDTVTLSAAGSSQGPTISYLWTSITGSLCGGETTPSACANAAGIYQLAVTRTYPTGVQFSTNCNVQVIDNTQPPVSSAGPDRNLTCADTVLTLNGNASSTGANFTYLWTHVPGGGIVSGGTTKTPKVNAPGTYTLLVTNTVTACTATDFIIVGVDTLHPTAEAGPGDQLSCSIGTAVLSGSATPAGMSPFWTTQNGDICAGANTFSPVVCDAGTYFLTVTNPVNGCKATDSTVVTKDGSVPDPDSGPDLFYTCTQQSFTINASVTGGSVLDYQWTALNGGCITGPSNILQPTVDCPGLYRLQVTDVVNGCTAVSQMEVIADTLPPVANPGSSKEINCDSLIVTLDGSGSTPAGLLSFEWSTLGGHFVLGETTPMSQVDSAGVYQLIVINQQNQCRDTATVSVTVDANLPVVNAGPDSTLTCIRTSFKLNGTGSSAGPGIFYTWTHLPPGGGIVSGANTTTPLIDLPGAYVLTVEDVNSQCVLTDTVVVAMDTISPQAVIAPQQILAVTCADNQVTLSGGQSTPAGGLNFHWQTQDGHIVLGVNAPNAVVDSSGTYLLTVTGAVNGCTAAASVFVGENFEIPAIQLAPAPVLNCDHPQVQLEVFPPGPNLVYTFNWSGPGAIQNPTTTTPTVGQSGVFHVTVTDTTNGCSSDSSLVVTQNFLPPVAVASSIETLDCENFVVQVSGQGSSGGNVTYDWTSASGGNIASPTALVTDVDAAGWYYFTVRRLDNGCTATDSTEVISSAEPIDDALISLDQADCRDPEGYIFIDSVFGGTPKYFYSLDSGIFITYPQFSYLDPGYHQLTIKDVNGCQWSATILLLEPGEVLVELGDDVYIRQGESATLLAQTNLSSGEVDTIIWQNLPDSTECPSCLEQTVSPEETTTYHIAVVDTNGCMAMDKITVIVNEERPFYAPTGFSPNGDGTNDRFLLYAGPDVVNVKTFRIFDRWGNLVFFAQDFPPNDPNFGWDGAFEGRPMNPAVFVWKAEVDFVDGTSGAFYGDVTLVR